MVDVKSAKKVGNKVGVKNGPLAKPKKQNIAFTHNFVLHV